MTKKLEKLLALAVRIGDPSSPTVSEFPFTGAVAIRTVTFYYTGVVRQITPGFVILGEAAWFY